MMTQQPHTRRWLAIAAAAVLLAGCADNDTASKSKSKGAKPSAKQKRDAVNRQYQSKLRAIDDRLNATMGSLFQSRRFTSAQVASAQAQLDRSARELEQLTPPTGVKDAHAKYLAGVRGFGPILTKLEAAQGDAKKIRAHLTDPQYSRVIGDLEKAKFRYEQAGYKL